MVYGYIYIVTCNVNGKVYVGQTTQGFDKRYYGKGITATNNPHLKNAINKYGVHNFTVDKQFDVATNQQELNELEKWYIYLFNATDSNYGYNILSGGGNRPIPNEVRIKMRDSHIGKKLTAAQRQKISQSHKADKNGFYGKKHSKESKEKMSRAKLGKTKARSESLMKPVICITTGERFVCMKDAAKTYSLDCGSLSSLLNGKGRRKTCGSLPDGTRLKWKFDEE